MRAWLERYANRLWYETERPPWPWRILSRLHAALLGERGQRPAGRPPVPVVVVGNLSVGGSGKTPTVVALALDLSGRGLKPAIISRGYGARGGAEAVEVTADSDPAACGDEPVLLAQSTGLPVWVCSDRRAALAAAVAAGAEVVVSDDGLQHHPLPRSFEIALVDGRRGFGNGLLLPAGPLRQPIERLEQVDAVLVRGGGATPAGPQQHLVIRSEALVRMDNGHRLEPEALAGQPVNAVCGIADPTQFVRALEALGQRPTLHAFPDHHRFTAKDLEGIAGPIVTTAKDAVKLRRLTRLPAGIHVLEIRALLPARLIQSVVEHVQQFSR